MHERGRKKKEKKADAYHHVNQLLVYVLEVEVRFLYYRNQYSIFFSCESVGPTFKNEISLEVIILFHCEHFMIFISSFHLSLYSQLSVILG